MNAADHPQAARWSRLATGLALVLLLAVTPGCLKLDAIIALQDDGSGTLQLSYSVPESLLTQMRDAETWSSRIEAAGGEALGTNLVPLVLLFDETQIRQRFGGAGRGMSVKKVRFDRRAGWRTAQVEISFRSFEDLCRLPSMRYLPVMLTESSRGHSRLSITLPELQDHGQPTLTDPQTESSLRPILAGMNVVITLSIPGAVKDTNGVQRDARTVRWEFDVDRNPTVLERMNRLPLYVIYDNSLTTLRPFSTGQLGATR